MVTPPSPVLAVIGNTAGEEGRKCGGENCPSFTSLLRLLVWSKVPLRNIHHSLSLPKTKREKKGKGGTRAIEPDGRELCLGRWGTLVIACVTPRGTPVSTTKNLTVHVCEIRNS